MMAGLQAYATSARTRVHNYKGGMLSMISGEIWGRIAES